MRRRKVTFVRILRTKEMKFGVAVDKAGKRWRGFYSNRTEDEVIRTADLGAVGLCMLCRDRVYQGWTCLNDGRDICAGCIKLPHKDKIFVVKPLTDEEWESSQKDFFRNEHFDHQRRDESVNRPCS